jgi:hypothetical protein
MEDSTGSVVNGFSVSLSSLLQAVIVVLAMAIAIIQARVL